MFSFYFYSSQIELYHVFTFLKTCIALSLVKTLGCIQYLNTGCLEK